MSTLQLQARALGDPTRHRIFRYIADAPDAVDVAELTEHFGLNHNAIRQHLAKLLGAGLINEDRRPAGGRGRPRLRYTPAPAIESRWGATGPYERLSLLLTEVVRSGDSPVDVGRRSIHRRHLRVPGTTAHGVDPVAELVEQMARQGFDPVVEQDDDLVDVTLLTCPFATAALADPDTVCALHLGMAYGIADDVEGLVVDELVPHDPRQGQCRLRCHLEDAPA